MAGQLLAEPSSIALLVWTATRTSSQSAGSIAGSTHGERSRVHTGCAAPATRCRPESRSTRSRVLATLRPSRAVSRSRRRASAHRKHQRLPEGSIYGSMEQARLCLVDRPGSVLTTAAARAQSTGERAGRLVDPLSCLISIDRSIYQGNFFFCWRFDWETRFPTKFTISSGRSAS